MEPIEVFQILGIEQTKDERALKNAYRDKLTVTNPEDDPEGFKRLREAYEAACEYAQNEEEQPKEEEKVKTKAKKATYIRGQHGSGAAKMKADIRKKRASRHKK